MTDTEQHIAGALVAGATLLTANAAFTMLAADAGIAWSGDTTVRLWHTTMARPPDGALARVYQRAIRRAIDELRGQYPHTGNACTLLQSFDLVAACASSAPSAEFPPTLTPAAIKQTLDANLDRLLYGHDEREVAFLQAHLLLATARALSAELAVDPTARLSYREWLSEP